MSTRAYKLIEIKTEKEPSFNYSHHYEFIQKFSNEYENESLIQITKDNLKNMKKYIDRGEFSNIEETKDEVIEIYNNIKRDIRKDDYVEYYLI